MINPKPLINLEQLENYLAPVKGRISYNEVKHFLTDRNLAAISLIKDKRSRITLQKLSRLIHPNSRFEFWQKVLSCREYLDKNGLFLLWYEIYNDRGNPCFQVIDTPSGEVRLETNVQDKKLLSSLPVTDWLLVDNQSVQYRYSQGQKKGWEMLRYLYGRRWQTLRLPAMVREAIDNDQAEKFVISMDISGQKFSSFSLLAEIINKKALNIFRLILKNGTIPGKVISMDELCACIVSSFGDSISLPLLQIIEEIHPGAIREVKDFWGRNMLWYAVHNMKTGWFHPNSTLVPFLIKTAGCNLDNQNHLGFSYKFVTENLSIKRKKQQMMRRYGFSKISWNSGNKLRTEQPLNTLENC